jgi:hypothetical protein
MTVPDASPQAELREHATRTFHLGDGGYGLMMLAFGLGALPGAMLAVSASGSPTGRRVGWRWRWRARAWPPRPSR